MNDLPPTKVVVLQYDAGAAAIDLRPAELPRLALTFHPPLRTCKAGAAGECDAVLIPVGVVDAQVLRCCANVRRESSVPIVLLVEQAPDDEGWSRVYETGVDECVRWPISPQLLQAKLQSWGRWTQRARTERAWLILSLFQQECSVDAGAARLHH